VPDLVVLNWYGMVLPAGAPREIVTRLHAEVLKAMKAPEIHSKLVSFGFDPVGSMPQEFAAFRTAEERRWAKVVKEAQIKAE